MQIAEHLKFLEEQLLDPTVRRDSKAVASYLTDDFLEFGGSGRAFDKAAILEDLAKESQDESFTSSTVVTSKRLFIAKTPAPKAITSAPPTLLAQSYPPSNFPSQ